MLSTFPPDNFDPASVPGEDSRDCDLFGHPRYFGPCSDVSALADHTFANPLPPRVETDADKLLRRVGH